jgi:hypothetical protein
VLPWRLDLGQLLPVFLFSLLEESNVFLLFGTGCCCVGFLAVTFIFVMLEIEPRALHILGKHSTTELHSQPLFVW